MRQLTEILTREYNVVMQYEIAVMLLAFLVTGTAVKERKKTAAVWTAVFLFFIYIHRILLPFAVSGVYLLLLSGIVCAAVSLEPKAALLPAHWFKRRFLIHFENESLLPTAVILTILLIQLNRINIAVDYDSLRYGLRSDVLLTGGEGIRGFFANTGLVNSVYTYPKGFELLTRPLYFGGTYGYVLCVNVWILIGIIFIVEEMAQLLTDSEEAGVFAGMITALIPGITNMSVTAKSDLSALMCQLVFIYCILGYIKYNDRRDGCRCRALTGIGTGAIILSYAFKPTALVFSSFIAGAVFIYFIRKKIQVRINRTGILALVLSSVFTGIITLRTWLIAGMPFTSVFTGVFEALGFRLRYPFRLQSFTDYKKGIEAAEAVRLYAVRLMKFLFCPTGDDMSHVLMAWGGLAFLLMIAAVLVHGTGTARDMGTLNRLGETEGRKPQFAPESFGFLLYIWAAAAVISLISLYMLYQVDGNYFMLIYALSALAGTTAVFVNACLEESGMGQKSGSGRAGGGNAVILVLSIIMIYFTAFTSWMGDTGFTPIDFINKGFYNHEALYRFGIPGETDRYARVVAFAGEPECYRLDARVESWVDIDGSGGNVYLTDTKLNIFKEYLDFADIDYIYAERAFLEDTSNERRVRANVLFTYLLEDGCFEDIVIDPSDAGRIYARLDKERVSVGWEEPMGDERMRRTDEQIALLQHQGFLFR